MNILCTSPLREPYVSSFDKVLSQFANVTYDRNMFFQKQGSFDFVFINWPEEIFDWNEPSESELMETRLALEFWAKTSRIVVTMHNEVPHSGLRSQKALLEMVYEAAGIVVHLGRASINMFQQRYGFVGRSHLVIPLIEYEYPDTISVAEAREKFRYREQDVVMLVFGSIRTKEELKFVEKVFSEWRNPAKKLLVSNYFDFSIRPFRYLRKTLEIVDRRLTRHRGRVDDYDVQYYFKAADIVFIPRLSTINSAIIPVASFFRRVFVGADIGNIGETLRAMGNPCFIPGDVTSAVRALDDAYRLSHNDLGADNLRYVEENCSADRIAAILRPALEKAINS